VRFGYIDAAAGLSGDMLLGALIGAGWDPSELKAIPEKLELHNVEIKIDKENRRGISGNKVNIITPHEHKHRHLGDIVSRINRASLPEMVKGKAVSVFRCLAEAEGSVHGLSPEDIHFHEVGAVDAMIDIVGVCQGLLALDIKYLVVSPIRLGSGTVKCEHGELPVPAPATSELIKGLSVYAGSVPGEWTTPTGAAIIKKWANRCEELPKMTVGAIGLGVGQANPEFPNILRLFVGEEQASVTVQTDEEVNVLETVIDDMPGEQLAHLMALLFKIPVRDAYFVPTVMKKGRPGHQLVVIVDQQNTDRAVSLVFKESSSFGLRIRKEKRFCLKREWINIGFEEDNIRVKLGYYNDELVQVSPEFEDCKETSLRLDMPIKEVYEGVRAIAKNLLDKEGSNMGGVE
jgi:uncharacterized protein (TIGR00299 family) protein